MHAKGPLAGVRVVEFAGLGPAPYGCMLLADLGAEIVRIERPETDFPLQLEPAKDILGRGRYSVPMNLKASAANDVALKLIERADVLVEGYRPGVMERMGLGPEVCLARNPKLVYARMTGWGQQGPMAPRAGHDMNYLALCGVLDLIGRAGEKPLPPLNLVADMGGGGLFLAFGIVCALYEARGSGRGQVVDAAMIDGVATLASSILSLQAAGLANGPRGTNVTDTGAHFNEVYETSDGLYMSVASFESRFYAALCRGANLDPEEFRDQMDARRWPELKEKLARIFKTKTRAEWTRIFDELDACVEPVLTLQEAFEHPHIKARGVYVERQGVMQPAALPRFSRTPGAIGRVPGSSDDDAGVALSRWGFTPEQIDQFRRSGAVVNRQ